ASTAVGWVVTLKLATHWFPKCRFAMLSGLGLMMGNIGALFAQVPLRLLVEHYGWRAVALGSAAAVLAIGAAAWAFVVNDPADKGYSSHAPLELRQSSHVTIGALLRDVPGLFAFRNTWLIFYLPFPLALFTGVAATTSFACGAVVVAFAFAKESVPVRFLGTISGTVNVGNMLGPTLLQPAIGWVLDRRWTGAFAGGARVYTAGAFSAAFTMIVVWALLSCLLIAITRETGCRQTA